MYQNTLCSMAHSVTEMLARKLDDSRVQRMIAKSTEKSKKRRKSLRSQKKGYSDKLKESEPIETYSTGAH